MKKIALKLILIIIIGFICEPIVQAESLFTMSASQTYLTEPKSLYGTVRARNVGDVLTILIEDSVSISDTLEYKSSKTSLTKDSFTNLVNRILPGQPLNDQWNNYGGSNTATGTSASNRIMKFNNSISVQVMQLLPNGNLVVQGKKTIVNANERMDLLVSGVIDPRFIDATGVISSYNVANLQFAVNGKGSASRLNNEGIINRFIRYLF